ncbi:hypothetical protein ACIQKE_20855 [Streptomyces griseoviridis]|uniref:Integral membrane protein n=1 Tax=Streptomyces hintoniae TaxID=3075521 RepID=A0ABU2UPV8_9ACTN|nr:MULTISPECIES: hypothetical protein [Streptomyces]MDH6702876.1 hypothetical protein [Streptomyces sp. MAA16]MDT0475308.1 hypothetical protein [Streptomyces sp. DSM 41014]
MNDQDVLTPALALRDIEARHPALRGAKSAMQAIPVKRSSKSGTERAKTTSGRDLPALLAGGATALGTAGAVLALADAHSWMRGPLTLFFLLAAPASALAAVLRGLDPLGRTLTALAGAIVVDMLVAQGMLAVHRWSVTGGIIAVTVISLCILLSCVTVKPIKT